MPLKTFQMMGGLAAVVELSGETLKSVEATAQLPRFRKLLEGRSPQVVTITIETLQDVAPLASSGLPMMISGSAQEAADMAVLLKLLSAEAESPLLHCFDETWVGGEVGRLGLVRETDFVPKIKSKKNFSDLFQVLSETFAKQTGRTYFPYEYTGHPEADRAVIAMGAEAETLCDAVEALNAQGEAVGLVRVRQYRPFDAREFLKVLPSTTRSLTVVEPLYQDVLAALHEGITGGWSWFTAFPTLSAFPAATPQKPLTASSCLEILGGKSGPLNETHSTLEILMIARKTDPAVSALTQWTELFGDRSERPIRLHWEPRENDQVRGHLRIGKKIFHAHGPIHRPSWLISMEAGDPQTQESATTISQGGIFLMHHSSPSNDGGLSEQTRSLLQAKDIRLFEKDLCAPSQEAGLARDASVGLPAMLLELLDSETWLGLSREKSFQILGDFFEKRWGNLGADIVLAHQKAMEAARRLIHSSTPTPSQRSFIEKKSGEADVSWMGWKLNSPFIATLPFDAPDSALTSLHDASIGAVFLGPILEEELRLEARKIYESSRTSGTASKIQDPKERYLSFLEKVKKATKKPVIVGLTAREGSDWLALAFALEQRGADGLELFLFPNEDARIVSLACGAARIPVGVRLTPYHSDLPAQARKAAQDGAKSLVLFHHPPISFVDPATRRSITKSPVSTEGLFWLALPRVAELSEECPLPLAVSGPAPTKDDAELALRLHSRVVFI